ncbi:MAG: anthrone oxygenase family protein [Rubricoccaceae bacterium]|nr:anthrone oxygenase family protein [Rubricoccaceae bacterium]
MISPFFLALLVSTTFLCALVAGFLFAFAVVGMPGLGRLDDGAFLRAFQAMDRVIQDNHPLFLTVWVGSVVTLVASALLGLSQLGGLDRLLLLTATAAYVVGVQVPTAAVNVPLNNAVQAVDVEASDGPARAAARAAFEARWTRWNRIRTVVACAVAFLLLALLVRL